MDTWEESSERRLPPFKSIFCSEDYERAPLSHATKIKASATSDTSVTNTANKENNYNTGHWTAEEQAQFLSAIEELGTRSAKLISTRIPTRTVKQVRTHSKDLILRSLAHYYCS